MIPDSLNLLQQPVVVQQEVLMIEEIHPIVQQEEQMIPMFIPEVWPEEQVHGQLHERAVEALGWKALAVPVPEVHPTIEPEVAAVVVECEVLEVPGPEALHVHHLLVEVLLRLLHEVHLHVPGPAAVVNHQAAGVHLAGVRVKRNN